MWIIVGKKAQFLFFVKSILFIDLFSEFGHNNLNKSYINKLIEIGLKVDLVLKENYIEELGLPHHLLKYSIPLRYFKYDTGKLRVRYNEIKKLRHISGKIDFQSYDYVFFSSFDEISLFLAGIKGNLILLNHANVAGFDNFIKRFFLKQLSKRATFIVFHNFIKNRFTQFGKFKVEVESLGLSSPYYKSENHEIILAGINKKLGSPIFTHIIFVPTGSKYASTFFTQVIKNADFLSFLQENQILLVIKDNSLTSDSANIIILKDFISEEKYKALFLESSIILIKYPSSFTYRVSAVFFECLSNQKPTLISDIESFRSYEPHFTYNPYFKDQRDLIEGIKSLISQIANTSFRPYQGIETFSPNFSYLLPV